LAAIWEYENIRQRAIAAIAPSMVWIKERMQARKNVSFLAFTVWLH
jgi:hypothetical protein